MLQPVAGCGSGCDPGVTRCPGHHRGEQEQGPRAACLPGLQSRVLGDLELDSVGLRGTEATKGQRAWEAPPAVLPAQGSRGVSLAHSRGPLCSPPQGLSCPSFGWTVFPSVPEITALAHVKLPCAFPLPVRGDKEPEVPSGPHEEVVEAGWEPGPFFQPLWFRAGMAPGRVAVPGLVASRCRPDTLSCPRAPLRCLCPLPWPNHLLSPSAGGAQPTRPSLSDVCVAPCSPALGRQCPHAPPTPAQGPRGQRDSPHEGLFQLVGWVWGGGAGHFLGPSPQWAVGSGTGPESDQACSAGPREAAGACVHLPAGESSGIPRWRGPGGPESFPTPTPIFRGQARRLPEVKGAGEGFPLPG